MSVKYKYSVKVFEEDKKGYPYYRGFIDSIAKMFQNDYSWGDFTRGFTVYDFTTKKRQKELIVLCKVLGVSYEETTPGVKD